MIENFRNDIIVLVPSLEPPLEFVHIMKAWRDYALPPRDSPPPPPPSNKERKSESEKRRERGEIERGETSEKHREEGERVNTDGNLLPSISMPV